MRYHSDHRGFTLVEAIIYIALLSSLIATFVPYASALASMSLGLVGSISDAHSP